MVWEERMGRRCGLEVVSRIKRWFGRSGLDEESLGRRGWDEEVVWKEWVGQRCGLGGEDGTKMWFGSSE